MCVRMLWTCTRRDTDALLQARLFSTYVLKSHLIVGNAELKLQRMLPSKVQTGTTHRRTRKSIYNKKRSNVSFLLACSLDILVGIPDPFFRFCSLLLFLPPYFPPAVTWDRWNFSGYYSNQFSTWCHLYSYCTFLQPCRQIWVDLWRPGVLL